MHKILLSLGLLLLIGQTYATILRVAGDGTQDFTLIQPAIAQSCDGDTVLVYPGRYIENLSMMGKNITLASLELTTGNLGYKHSTTIDGNQAGSVIIIQNGESDVTIRGFTITNGSGWFIQSYGTSIGGGIQIGGLSGNRNVSLINNVICNNKSLMGGGVFISTANVWLSGTSIFDNVAHSGGGLRFDNTYTGQWSLSFDSVNRSSIYNNFANQGSDLFTIHKDHTAVVVDTFTVVNPWNFYASGIAADRTIINPFTFDILHTTGHQEINQDLYVAPWGSDSNSGTSPQDPFQTIFKATYMIASDSQNPKTIYLAEGVYSPSLNNQILPAPFKSDTNIVGVSEELTIIDAEGGLGGFTNPPHNENNTISHVAIRNAGCGLSTWYAHNTLFKNLKIHDLQDDNLSYGITIQLSSNTELENIDIDAVTSHHALGISVDTSKQLLEMDIVNIRNVSSVDYPRGVSMTSMGTVSINRLSITQINSSNNDEFAFNSILQIVPFPYAPSLKVNIANSLFADNYQENRLKSMMFVTSLNDTTTIQNCTFAANRGGNSVLGVARTVRLINNIFWNPDLAYEIELPFLESGEITNLSLEYNNIRGGSNGVLPGSAYNTINWGEGNLAFDPLFRLQTEHRYGLSQNSPLIDLGTPSPSGIEPGLFDLVANERFWDGNGDGIVRIDIGAYEYQNLPRPLNLACQVLENFVTLSWEIPQSNRELTGFRVYRNGLLIAELSDTAQTNYVDTVLISGTYRYFITAMYGLLESDPSDSVETYVNGVASEDLIQPPALFSLSLMPNPFRASTSIRYTIPKDGQVKLEIYNIKGQLVSCLINTNKAIGEHQVTWDGFDQAKNSVASGLYFARLQANGKVLTSKILKLK